MRLSNSLYCRVVAAIVVLLVTTAQIVAPADSDVAPLRLFFPSFFYPAGWSVTLFLSIILSTRDRAFLAASIAACAAAGALAGVVNGGSFADIEYFSVIAVGLAPFLFILARIAANVGVERSRWIDVFAVATLIYLPALGTPLFRDNTAAWLPGIVDFRIATYEEALGVQLSGVMANVFTALPILQKLSVSAYIFVQFAIVVVVAFDWRRKEADGVSILPAFIIAAFIGFSCYWLTPAVGPKAYFGADFPLLHATAAYLSRQPLLDFDLQHARNAMPSLHITWAFLVFLYSRGFPAMARIYAALFLFLTACATLGLGQHYFMDLVVAAPLIVLVRALCATSVSLASAQRLSPLAASFAMLAFWIATIRLGPTLTPPIVVALVGGTLAASILFERALARNEARAGNTAAAPDEKLGVGVNRHDATPSVA